MDKHLSDNFAERLPSDLSLKLSSSRADTTDSVSQIGDKMPESGDKYK